MGRAALTLVWQMAHTAAARQAYRKISVFDKDEIDMDCFYLMAAAIGRALCEGSV